MVPKLTRLIHKIAIQLHLVAERCTTCSSRSRRPVRKLLDTPPYTVLSSLCTCVLNSVAHFKPWPSEVWHYVVMW